MTYLSEKRQQVYQNGLDSENRIIEYLSTTYGGVRKSTKEENIFQDIDCYVGDSSVSIKTQHAGLRYNNIYFELAQLNKHTNKWEPSWYYTGSAKYYLILQGTTIRLYLKTDIQFYVDRYRWNHVRTLGKEAREYSAVAKKYIDSRCGFLNPDSVKHQVIQLY